MTNKEIFDIALKQSALDCNCSPDDFLKSDNIIVISKKNDKARRYLEFALPFDCDLVSYGNNIVASVSDEFKEVVSKYIEKYSAYRCFETPNLLELNNELQKFNFRVCHMAEYFLPDVEKLKALPCNYETRVLHSTDLIDVYSPSWSNALTSKNSEHDVLGVGAYKDGKLIGLAACSDDCESMYQIGVDVLPEYRRNGIASALTSRLALEILKMGKVPFYCAAWSNIKSVKNAIKCGFYPAWVEITAKSTDYVNKLLND
ncbi:MAG: GNAT family N-acetyltransferase [Ruminococcus sp.]|nr:GNAT family N-acetyltransferase [Ruminococcus sp.]